ncbi:MAG: M20/M25/M40 family metallo-hydrolase [Anaerolineales bacterium]|jgi:acetylornithine deacetylase/succinyl-diaminopimelate desuccinylase-like protein
MFVPDWDAATQETVEHLSRLVRAQTVNPPGNEGPAVRVIKEILDREGLPPGDCTIVESAPGRVSLVARVRGDGSLRPLLMSGHTDVVPAEPEYWTHDPFGGEVIDGSVWGRGTFDMKGFLAMYLQVFLQACRQRLPLKRDLILAAVADEEAGFEHGSKFLVDQRRSLIEAEYGITESGALTIYLVGRRLYPIQVSERGVCWMKMITRGEPGHGSIPHVDNAVQHLAQTLESIRRARHLPVHLTPTFRRMIHEAGWQLGFPVVVLTGLMRSPAVVGFVLDHMPQETRGLLAGMTTNTVTPTMLHAGVKANVIPSTAEATLDCRKLPGQSVEDVIREIRAIAGERFDLEPIHVTQGTEFSPDTPFYRALERAARRMDPEGIVFPMLIPGATDASEYQRAGIQMYGFSPGILPEDFPVIKLTHGHDERLPVSFLRSGLPALWEVLRDVCL